MPRLRSRPRARPRWPLRVLAWLLAAACAGAGGVGARADDDAPEPPAYVARSVAGLKVVAVTPAQRRGRHAFAPFYQRIVSLDGFVIQASHTPADAALLEAAWIIGNMLAKRPDLLDTLRRRGIRCTVMGHDELTTLVPEHADLRPARWWDHRARGLGPAPRRPIVSCGEENLLAYPGDPYHREHILVHEFAHAIDLEALRHVEDDFADRLEAAYREAMAAGRWKGTYAATNKEEYWAEGVQSYFDANAADDPSHGAVDTREELAAHDPGLYRLIAKAFRENPWRYVPVRDRIGTGHLADHDPADAPRFAWPVGLTAWYREYERRKASGEGRLALPALAAADRPAASPPSHEATRILFVNERAEEVRLFWIAYDGTRKPYGTVAPGRSEERQTFVGHLWAVTTSDGAEIARFRSGPRAGRARIHPAPTTK